MNPIQVWAPHRNPLHANRHYDVYPPPPPWHLWHTTPRLVQFLTIAPCLSPASFPAFVAHSSQQLICSQFPQSTTPPHHALFTPSSWQVNRNYAHLFIYSVSAHWAPPPCQTLGGSWGHRGISASFSHSWGAHSWVGNEHKWLHSMGRCDGATPEGQAVPCEHRTWFLPRRSHLTRTSKARGDEEELVKQRKGWGKGLR